MFKFLAHIISISILILQQCPSLVDRRTWSYGNRCFSPNSFRDRSGVWGVIAFIQMAEFIFGEGHSIDELATLPKRIMLSSMQALPEIFFKLCNQIFAGSNSLLMCTLYYVCFVHGLPKNSTALSKISLEVKQVSYIRKSVKGSSRKVCGDKCYEGTRQESRVDEAELRQTIKTALATT